MQNPRKKVTRNSGEEKQETKKKVLKKTTQEQPKEAAPKKGEMYKIGAEIQTDVALFRLVAQSEKQVCLEDITPKNKYNGMFFAFQPFDKSAKQIVNAYNKNEVYEIV